MILFLLWSCADVKPTDSDANEEPTASVIDTAIEEEESFFEPSLFTMFSFFGLEGDTVRSFFIDETEVNPYVQIVFYNDDQSESCSVAAVLDSGSVVVSDWSFDDVTDSENPVAMSQQGFLLPSVEDVQIVTSDGCAEWNPDVYGDLEEKIDHAWGVGFGGALRADVEAAVQESTNERLQYLYGNDYLIAGSWASNLWEPSTWASHTFTVAAHEEWTLSVDEDGYPTTYHTRAELEAGVYDAIYILNPIFLWSYSTFFE
ncbi:MAG: hypothetical protein VX278_09590 [Myxococcota bacterium]|nr:hypothetical protein [Myxococcota bacterium]